MEILRCRRDLRDQQQFRTAPDAYDNPYRAAFVRASESHSERLHLRS